MVIFKGFEVTIQVDGRNLEEFGDDLKEVDADSHDLINGNTVTRYVEAVSNAQFSIVSKYVDECKLPEVTYEGGVSYMIMVDGLEVGHWRSSPPGYNYTMSEILEKKGGQCFKRKLFFSNLQIVDTVTGILGYERAREMEAKIRNAGIIEIRILRIKCSWDEPWKGRSNNPVLDKGETVPEAALKGDSKSHYIDLSNRVKVSDRPVWNSVDIDSENHPYAKFQFKYCSRKCLEDMLIVPRPPPLEERDVNNLTPEELKELVLRMRKRQSEQLQIDSKIKNEFQTEQVIGVKRQRELDNEDMEQTGEQAVRRGGSTIPIVPCETVDLMDE